MQVHIWLEFATTAGETLWSLQLPAPVRYQRGDRISLRTTIAPGCESLWPEDIRINGTYEVLGMHETFDTRYGAVVASVITLHYITVTVREVGE